MSDIDPIAAWSRDLTGEVVAPLPEAATGAITAAAVASVGAAGGAAAAAAVVTHTAAKVIASVALVAVVGGGVAAVTGNLPDPIQTFVADLLDGVGIDLPRPIPVLPSTTVPSLPSVELTVPVVTSPVSTLP